METLIQLIQLGGLGAGLAFLVLGYRLLKVEINKSRSSLSNLAVISMFMTFSLIFFLTGAAVEIVFRSGSAAQIKFTEAFIQILSPPHYTQKAFKKINFDPKSIFLEFFVFDSPFDKRKYFDRASSSDLHYLVAFRARTNEAEEDRGLYDVVSGPYKISEQRNGVIPASVTETFKTQCIDAAIFIMESNVIKTSIQRFSPEDYGVSVSDFRQMCR